MVNAYFLFEVKGDNLSINVLVFPFKSLRISDVTVETNMNPSQRVVFCNGVDGRRSR